MNHTWPKALKERPFISYSVLTVPYQLTLGNTSGVPVANEMYAFLLVNEEIATILPIFATSSCNEPKPDQLMRDLLVA